jgi:hypothetical protein
MRHHVGNISIFKPENSPFWTAYYRDDAGSQKKKSLKTRNLKVAKAPKAKGPHGPPLRSGLRPRL